jgi:hypothetical protein
MKKNAMIVGFVFLMIGGMIGATYTAVTGDALTSNVEANTLGRVISGLTVPVFAWLGWNMWRMEREMRQSRKERG